MIFEWFLLGRLGFCETNKLPALQPNVEKRGVQIGDRRSLQVGAWKPSQDRIGPSVSNSSWLRVANQEGHSGPTANEQAPCRMGACPESGRLQRGLVRAWAVASSPQSTSFLH